ncbi:MAG TPA: SRPBCC family protein [Candidatus Saccharimonadales bacterium]|nr:SRPBCC family protein [Candidatus Saccharimonadales bacterium]
MIDIVREIDAVRRAVGSGRIPAGEGRSIRLSRTYDAPIDDVWDALTSPERISRWFLPISGDYRVGGTYQLEGNAGGEILACERPDRFRVSWAYGDPSDPASVSELEVRLTAEGDHATRLELDHTAVVPDEMWGEYGPGAVGVGWDQGMLGLSLYLRTGETVGDPVAWQLSDEGREYAARSSAAWGAANVAAGADPEAAARGVANTIAFYAPPPVES